MLRNNTEEEKEIHLENYQEDKIKERETKDSQDDEFFRLKTKGESLYEEPDLNEIETSRYMVSKDEMIDFETNELARKLIEQRFVEKHFGVDKLSQDKDENGMDEDAYGDFEDLEKSTNE